MPNATRRAARWMLPLGLLALVVVALVPYRARLEMVDSALPLLIVVLVGSAVGGRAVGFALALLGFGAIDYLFQPPFDTFAVHKGHDWLVLGSFLAAAAIATQLLARMRAEAAEARRRAAEVQRLAAERVQLVADAEHAAALREADRLKDMLLASVSHDLRTPLTTIKALAHAAAQRGDADAAAIEEEADRLTRMVADVLDLSRARAGTIPLALELNAAEDLVGAVVRQTGALFAARKLERRLDAEDGVLLGRFDFVASLRILGNLLENATKYAPPERPVELRVRREGAELLFEVADRGPGVPESERDRIFAPFYRSSHAPADVGGAGLGLAVASALAKAQGGSLVYAPREGGGGVFTLRLPAADVDEASLEVD